MVKRNLTCLLVLLLSFCLYNARAQQLSIPSEFTGNWMRTDGSNEFVIGFYGTVVCYDNDTWTIKSRIDGNTGTSYIVSNGSSERAFSFQGIDTSGALTFITVGNPKETLKRVRTNKYSYKPAQPIAPAPFFMPGIATIRGLILLPRERRSERESYIQVNYENKLTGETDYYFGEIDSTGRFSISFPVYKMQLCNLKSGYDELGEFYIQPGSNLLITVNKRVNFLYNDNPDFDQLMQKICFMGDEGLFNNHYQHFLAYSKSYGFPELRIPAEAVMGLSTAEKKKKKISYYTDLYAKLTKAVNYLYPSSKVEKRYIDFLSEEIKYKCGIGLLSDISYDLRPDSNDLRLVYSTFLSGRSGTRLLHDSYFRLAADYVDRLNYNRTGGRYTYSFQQNKMDERIKNDYGLLLSKDFMRHYEEINRDRMLLTKMTEKEIIARYFDGNEQDAMSFGYLNRKISNEFFKEAKDSSTYATNQQDFKDDPVLQFAANLNNLLATNSDDDVRVPSIYRLALFKQFNANNTTPWRLVDSLVSSQLLSLAVAGLQVKMDDLKVKEVNNEKDWQESLKKYKGKVVVAWSFNHYFQKEYAMRNLYEMQKMEQLYKGKNVVFVKCILQRHRSDKVSILLDYLRLFRNNNSFNDIYYVERNISLGVPMMESSIRNVGIYNENGIPHHPDLNSERRRSSERFTVAGELDSVLAGKGKHIEYVANYYFMAPGIRGSDPISSRYRRGWTIFTDTGNYVLLVSKEPTSPVSDNGTDTVFTQFTFGVDSMYYENKLMLHKLPKSYRDDRLFSSPSYSKEFQTIPGERARKYLFNSAERLITIYNNDKSIYKQYRVLAINQDLMSLERLQ